MQVPPGSDKIISYLPSWLVLSSFIFSFFYTVLGVIYLLIKFFKPPVLNVRLTKEVFFRLTDMYGESIFTNAVLLVREKPIEIIDINFVLKKISGGGTKEFLIVPEMIGKKVKNNEVIANHFFETSSPKTFINSNSIKKPLFLATFKDYKDCYVKGIQEFNLAIDKEICIFNKEKNINSTKDLDDLGLKALNIVNTYTTKLSGLVQIEEGQYDLQIDVTYRGMGMWNREKKANSNISFQVDSNFKDLYNLKIRESLTDSAKNMLYNTHDIIPSPEYVPLNVIET